MDTSYLKVKRGRRQAFDEDIVHAPALRDGKGPSMEIRG